MKWRRNVFSSFFWHASLLLAVHRHHCVHHVTWMMWLQQWTLFTPLISVSILTSPSYSVPDFWGERIISGAQVSFLFISSLPPHSSLLCKVRFLEVGALSYQTNKTPNHSRYSSRQHRSRQPPPSRPSSSLSSLSSSPHGAAAARPCHTPAFSIVTCTSQPTVAPTTWGQQDETMKGSFVTGVA